MAWGVIGAVGGPSCAQAAPYTLRGTEMHVLPRSANGRDYTLYVGVPSSYSTSPSRRYPVVYITDGYWDFHLLMWETGNLVVDGAIPECIVVGIAYSGDNPDNGTLRTWDLTPGYDPYAGQNSGHAQEFLAVIENQFIPFVQQQYRADPSYRVLGGSSYGGLFTAYALFERPGLFNAYISISPSLWYRSNYISSRLTDYARTHTAFNTRVFLSYAADDAASIRTSTASFARQLRSYRFTGLASAVREIEGERHSGTKAEGFHRGLRFAFAPLAPSPLTLANKGFGSRSPLVNVSTRARLGTGFNVMIAGFVIDGPETKRVLVRAVGPGLIPQGVSGTVSDPRFTVMNATQQPVGSNDNWTEGNDASAISAAAAQVGAFPLGANSRDAATLLTLEPGLYTVVAEGVNGSDGVALVEVYEVL